MGGSSRLLSFLLFDSNSQPINSKKYLLSIKVISKASLKILKVNIYVEWSISLSSILISMHISNWFVIVCNIQIVIPMLYHSFETLLLLGSFYLMVKSSKSFVKIGSGFQIALLNFQNKLWLLLFTFWQVQIYWVYQLKSMNYNNNHPR